MSDIYIHTTKNTIVKTDSLNENVNIDRDSEGNIVGIEVLNAKSIEIDGQEVNI